MTTTPPDWYPDPGGVHELRYFDGTQWTDHVSNHGVTSVDPVGQNQVPTTNTAPTSVQGQVHKAGAAPTGGGGGTLFTEPILVVNQKRKLIEVNRVQLEAIQDHTQKSGLGFQGRGCRVLM